MLLRDGTVVAQGLLEAVLTKDNLAKTFGVDLVLRRSGARYFAYRR
jgi:iron complex transport system ATP-binding protein